MAVYSHLGAEQEALKRLGRGTEQALEVQEAFPYSLFLALMWMVLSI